MLLSAYVFRTVCGVDAICALGTYEKYAQMHLKMHELTFQIFVKRVCKTQFSQVRRFLSNACHLKQAYIQ